ncbi:MAG: hypothetical protein ACI9BW_000007 [Gammaproteobacteria bacterium]|jgi:hypothetical protein
MRADREVSIIALDAYRFNALDSYVRLTLAGLLLFTIGEFFRYE